MITSTHRSTPLRTRVAVFGLLPMLLFFLWNGVEELDRRKGVSPRDMIIPVQQLPLRLTTSTPQSHPFSWKESGTTRISSIPTSWESQWRAGNAWTNGGEPDNTPFISHSFDRYATALSASFAFLRTTPNIDYIIDAHTVTLTPSLLDLAPDTFTASQYRILCMLDTQQHCLAWQAWLRYGAYIAEIQMVNDTPFSTTDVLNIAKTIDTFINQKFSAATPDYPTATPFFLRPTAYLSLLWVVLGPIALLITYAQRKIVLRSENNTGKAINQSVPPSDRMGALLLWTLSLGGGAGAWAIAATSLNAPVSVRWLVYIVIYIGALVSWGLALYYANHIEHP